MELLKKIVCLTGIHILILQRRAFKIELVFHNYGFFHKSNKLRHLFHYSESISSNLYFPEVFETHGNHEYIVGRLEIQSL